MFNIPVEKAEQACNALAGMNRTYALEIKLAEVQKTPTIRILEIKSNEQEEAKLTETHEVKDDVKKIVGESKNEIELNDGK